MSILNLHTATQVLTEILKFEQPADATLGQIFRSNKKYGQRDRAAISAAVYGILRRKVWLDWLLGEATARQLLIAWLVKVQGHNLRALETQLSESEQQWVGELKAKNSKSAPPAAQADLPDWLFSHLTDQRGGEQTVALGRAMQQAAPLDLRVNTLLAKRDAVLDQFVAEGFEAQATPYSPVGIRLKGKPSLHKHPLFTEGKIEVQDEGSQLLAYLLGAKRHHLTVDFCAGAGGKTLALGAMMSSKGRLYAFDVAQSRLSRMQPRLKRSGLSNVETRWISSEKDAKVKRLANKIDRVLVDAPCTGSGTLRRNPDLKWRQNEQAIAELNVKQASILESAARLVKPGGRLVYATCSLLEEENQHIVQAFLGKHPEFRLIPANALLAKAKINLDTGDYLQLSPAEHGTDGFFGALIERV